MSSIKIQKISIVDLDTDAIVFSFIKISFQNLMENVLFRHS